MFRSFQMGVVVYGYRPKIWFLLNRHERSDTLLQEIQSTPFDESPGNNIGQVFFYEMTDHQLCSCSVCVRRCDVRLSPSAGEAVKFTRQYVLTAASGRRPRVPGVVVIIADKRSADNLTVAANELRAAGVTAHLFREKINAAKSDRLHPRPLEFCGTDITVWKHLSSRCDSVSGGHGPGRH